MESLRVVQGNDLKAASQIAGWVGVQADLNTVNDMCLVAWDLIGGEIENAERASRNQFTVLRSLYVTALVTYARCFGGCVPGSRSTMSRRVPGRMLRTPWRPTVSTWRRGTSTSPIR